MTHHVEMSNGRGPPVNSAGEPFDGYGVRYDIIRSMSSRSNALQLRDIRVQTEKTEPQRKRATVLDMPHARSDSVKIREFRRVLYRVR